MDSQPSADSSEINQRQCIDASIDCTPKKRRGRPPRALDAAEWWPRYVEAYRECGSVYLAADRAGVSVPVARHYRRSHPEAHRALLAARAYFRANLEYLILQIARGEVRGNVIAALARSKAASTRLAGLYSEKAIDASVLNLQINHYNAPPAAQETLASLLAGLSPARLKALQGHAAYTEDVGIVDAELSPEEPAE